MKISQAYIFGELSPKNSWTAADLGRICAEAARRAEAVRNAKPDYVISVLAKAGALFSDKKSPWRKAAFSHIRGSSSFSAETLEMTLDVIPRLLDAGELEKRTRLELFLPYALEEPVPRQGYDGLLCAVPKGVVLHAGAGNVFLGLLDSLVMGILTRNANIAKMATNGSRFAVLFAQALKACDPKGLVSGSVAVLGWKGGDSAVEEAAVGGSDCVFVWGGEEAVRAYRRIAPARVHVAGFGPKASAAVITEEALSSEPIGEIAEKIALDASLWDQAACSSPHTVFVVSPRLKKEDPLLKKLSHEIALAFAGLERKLPQEALSADEQVEITAAREIAKVDEAVGKARLESSFPAPHWTVISEKNSDFRFSPLNRTLYLKCVSSLAEVRAALKAHKGLIQSVGAAGLLEERKRVALALAPAGIARVAAIGKMLEAVPGSPHDGIFPMRELVNFIGIEGKPSAEDKLSALVSFAREKSPFYKKRYAGLPPVRTLGDFAKLPLLSKQDILANTPPDSERLFTAPITNGIYFASGGSTGSPKYIFYDAHEYDRVAMLLARALSSAGLGADDRAANLFTAGNLWSSWLSIEKALARTKAVSVPVGSSLPFGAILGYLDEFKVTALIGLPSFLLKVAEAVEEKSPRYKIPLRFIFYGGEYVGEEMAAYFKKVFPGVLVRSAAYATVDGGVIGFQCPDCGPRVHHLFSDEQYIEILDMKTGLPVSGEKTGELVITVLNKRHMPIIRFRAGDLARWMKKPCGCGRPEPLFEILGRCDDRIHVGGAHLFLDDIHRAAAQVPGLSFNFQVEVSNKSGRDSLIIRAETKKELQPAELAKLKTAFISAVRENCADLAYSIDHKWLDSPSLELLLPGGIGRSARTGKIARVVDLRSKL